MNRETQIRQMMDYIKGLTEYPYVSWADIPLGQVFEAAGSYGNTLGAEYEQAMSERDAKHPWPDPLER